MSDRRGLPPKGLAPVGMPPRKNRAPGNHRPTAEEARQMQTSRQYQQVSNFPLNYRPGQMRSSGSQSSGSQTSESFCKSCYDMNPLIEKSKNPNTSKLDSDQMKIMLRHVLQTSDKCPFCNLLMCLFRTYVDDAEERITRDRERRRDTLGGPQASVSVNPGHPVVITFREGIHTKYSITRDPIVEEPKYEPGNLYYPPPIQLYRTGERLSGWPELGYLKDPEQRVNENFRFFKDSLKDCRTYHENICGQGGERLPKRLLYIGATDADTIKLIEPLRDSTSVYRYAAVSHRWANKELMFRTLRENIKDRFQRIDKKGMPRVLQDAIEVTRALDLRYLWMDTICMIQDDEVDKKKEMLYMGEYYANAFFTIAASSSGNSTVPFIDRRNFYYKPHSFPFKNSYVKARVLGVEGHLAKRGWTWQESTFSARLLNFTPSELVWECKGVVESECGYDPQLFNSLGLAHKYGNLDDESDTQSFALWRDCIQAYSNRKLTDFTDCLSAVSGLAKSIKKRTQSDYYAGIWVKDMIPGLLWDVPRGFDREISALPKVPNPKDMDTGNPKECIAPSWSWASVEGWVRTSDKRMTGSTKYASYPLRGSDYEGNRSFAGLKQDANIEVVGRDLRRLTSDDFLGEMRAVLKIEGRLIQVSLICDWQATTGWAYKLEFPDGSKPDFTPDTELEPFTRSSWPREKTVRRSNVVPKEYFSAMVHCLLIAEGRTHEGLVLGRSEDSDHFMRLGFFSFDKLGHFDGVGRKLITIA